LNPTADRVL